MAHLRARMTKCRTGLPVILFASALLFSSCLLITRYEVFAQTNTVTPERDANGKGESPLHPHSDPSARVFGVLALIVSCAAIGRLGARKLKQSPVLGELAVGIIVGSILYQFAGPTVTIIRHYDIIQRATEKALAQGEDWHTTVRSSLAQAGLSTEVAERVERVFLSRDFPADLSLAKSIQLFASFGVVMLLFMVGLEVSLKELKAIGGSAAAVAAIGVSLTFILSYFTTSLLLPKAAGFMPPLFAGAAFCASSIGITARILMDMNSLEMTEAKTVLGAAVMDDVLGLIVLAVVTAVATTGRIEVGSLFWILLKTVLFLGAVIIFGIRYLERTVQFLAKLDLGRIKVLYPFALLMLLAWLADKIGLAAIIGAFAAGVIIKEESFDKIGAGSGHDQSVEAILGPIEHLLAPIFFVLIGLQVDVTTLADVKVLLMGLLLTAVAVAGKLAASLGVMGGADRLIVGIGMLPRVEVALIVASMGKSLGVLDNALYSVIIIVVSLTVLITPPLLKWSIERKLNKAPGAA
ncbi:MAG: cation:proton antiporter [Syntrophobacteraceae bacterium]|jgi:Kef-type K+ transport system membrane component KefB